MGNPNPNLGPTHYLLSPTFTPTNIMQALDLSGGTHESLASAPNNLVVGPIWGVPITHDPLCAPTSWHMWPTSFGPLVCPRHVVPMALVMSIHLPRHEQCRLAFAAIQPRTLPNRRKLGYMNLYLLTYNACYLHGTCNVPMLDCAGCCTVILGH